MNYLTVYKTCAFLFAICFYVCVLYLYIHFLLARFSILYVPCQIGFLSSSVPLYIAEASPTHCRGRLVAFHVAMVTGGQLLGTIVAGAFSGQPQDGWRCVGGKVTITGYFFLATLVVVVVAQSQFSYLKELYFERKSEKWKLSIAHQFLRKHSNHEV